MDTIDRRHLIVGSAAAFLAGCAPDPASAAPPGPWRAYDRRLQAGLVRTRQALDTATSDALLQETNTFRESEGLPPLADHPELALAAQAHLADMQERKFFAHESPEGFTASARAGLLCRTLLGAFGENIAIIQSARRAPSAGQFYEGWRDSPGHRANMLKADYTHVGHAALRYGPRVLAGAVFATVRSRLQAPLPLEAGGADLNHAMQNATPSIRGYMLSDPQGEEDGTPRLTVGPSPRLTNGAWRVRPLLYQSVTSFEILWGPIFFVGD